MNKKPKFTQSDVDKIGAEVMEELLENFDGDIDKFPLEEGGIISGKSKTNKGDDNENTKPKT